MALLSGLLLVVWFVAFCCLALFWSFFVAGGSGCAGTLKAKFILFNCDITGDRRASSNRRKAFAYKHLIASKQFASKQFASEICLYARAFLRLENSEANSSRQGGSILLHS